MYLFYFLVNIHGVRFYKWVFGLIPSLSRHIAGGAALVAVQRSRCTHKRMRVRTHAHMRARPPQRAAIRRARRVPRPPARARSLRRPHAIALHSGTLRRVRKKRTQEARGRGAPLCRRP